MSERWSLPIFSARIYDDEKVIVTRGVIRQVVTVVILRVDVFEGVATDTLASGYDAVRLGRGTRCRDAAVVVRHIVRDGCAERRVVITALCIPLISLHGRKRKPNQALSFKLFVSKWLK